MQDDIRRATTIDCLIKIRQDLWAALNQVDLGPEATARVVRDLAGAMKDLEEAVAISKK